MVFATSSQKTSRCQRPRGPLQDLLLQIARCPNVAHCLSGAGQSHPCSTIVNHQRTLGIHDPYVPVPWIGHIETAPILFLSSNPSVTGVDFAPKAS